MKSSLFTKASIFAGNTGLRAAGILLFILVVQLTVVAQTTVYIDPSFTGSPQNGTISNPYSSWSQSSFVTGNTYLQKRGTTASITGSLWVFQRSNVTIGAYGNGNRPKVISSGTDVKVIDFGNSSNCIVRDLEVCSTGNATTGVFFAAGCSNNLIDNCDIHDCEWGVRVTTTGGGNRILNSEIHFTGDDGVYIKDVTNIEIGYCHIYDVNRKWFINPDQSYSPGDCIQISSTNNLYYNIHHNILDHTSSGNKFCFISYGVNYTGLIEHNTMIGNAANVTSCIYFHATTGTVTVRYNTLQDGNYAIYSYVDNLQFHYNRVLNNKYGVRVLNNHNITALNNVFYGNETYCINSLSGTAITSRNNAFFLIGNTAQAYSTGGTVVSNNNNFNLEQSNFINGYSTLASWRTASGNDINSFVSNPLFVNPAIDDFCLQANSPCINSGTNVNLPFDYFGTAVPQGNTPDVGLHEVITSTGNQAPVISNQTFSIAENSTNGTVVGQVVASDPNAGQTITYTITGGNSSNAFVINSNTGALAVANSVVLNYETIPSFQLNVQVQDNGTGNLTASAIITVNLNNVNEVPTMSAQTFSIGENTTTGTLVGTMLASDPDQGQTITYSIASGNTNTAFAINATSGAITVNNTQALNYESQPSFQLVIRAQDNGTPGLFVNANVQINIVNVNENPIINNQTFVVGNYSPNGTVVGTVAASDPDLNQVINYSITAGNTGTAFAINSSTGVITVANSSMINYLVNPVFNLTVRVQDNGTPVLSSFGTITITVTPTNSAPIIGNQSFTINENSPAGTSVGQIVASDPDPGQTLVFSVISGNTGSTFQVGSSGLITVANPQLLNFETQSSFMLVIQVTDNGVPQLSSSTNIGIAINNVNETPVVTANQSFTIAEHVSTGTQVGTVVATDPDNGQNLAYSIISGNTNNAFSISPATGMISVSGTVCFENCSQYSLVIRATDNGSPALWDQKAVAILLTNVNENPVINNQAFAVNSYSATGTVVGSVIASDPDFNQVLSYSFTSGNTGSTFAINASTGVITVANNSLLNYITNPVFNLVVRVQDNGTPVLSSSATVTVTVTPVNTAPSVSNQAFTVAENTPLGVIIGNVVATDPDPGQVLTFALTTGNTAGAFQIGANGILSVANPSAVNFETNPVFQLGVSVTDNGQPQLTASSFVTVSVTNVNELPVISANLNFSINELVPTGTVVGTVSATDPDAGQALTYSIVSGNTNNAFAISATTGAISVAGIINFESISQFALSVRATDNGSPVMYDQEETCVIQINNINEQPIINNQAFSSTPFAPNGTVIGTVVATDPDANQTLAYSIQSGNTNNAFVINAGTGVISIANSTALNPATSPVFTLNVNVQDNGNPSLSSSASVTISLNNVNNAPTIAPQAFNTDENRPVGSVIGTVLASDPNAGQVLSFTIVSGNTNNAFVISTSGVITINNALAVDFETNPSFTLLVKVTDNGSPALWAQAPVTITVNDKNDAPVILPQSFSKKENEANGSYVGKVVATDQDAGQWTLTFSIVGGNTGNAFKIQANTGRIFVNNASAINYEDIPVFYLLVSVKDSYGASSQATMTINIINVNEAPVVSSQSFSVNKNAPNGTIVGTVVATDPDQNTTLKYAITQGNTSGIFAIGLYTGSLTVANSTALQNSTANSFTLVVKVSDNGSPILSTNGYETITVLRNKETGELVAETATERLNLLLSVYPNPSADGIFNIELKEESFGETTLTVTDITGKKVGEASSLGMMNFRLDLGYLPSGVYLMHAQNAGKHTVKKLIRQ